MKYKVGDKVRIRKDLEVSEEYGFGWTFETGMKEMLGKIVTIKNVAYSHYSIEETGFGWTDEMIEGKVNMTKEDLKDYDKVTLRNGREAIVFEGRLKDVRISCWQNIDLYDNDLKYVFEEDEDQDIIKVERPTYETIYIREEEPKEMTLKEVCEELGYEIKLIKEEK